MKDSMESGSFSRVGVNLLRISFADKVSLPSENGTKYVIVPKNNFTELSNRLPTFFGNRNVPFHQNIQMQKEILPD